MVPLRPREFGRFVAFFKCRGPNQQEPPTMKETVMRATILSLMTTVLIASAAPLAQAHEPAVVRQVEVWYAQYLGLRLTHRARVLRAVPLRRHARPDRGSVYLVEHRILRSQWRQRSVLCRRPLSRCPRRRSDRVPAPNRCLSIATHGQPSGVHDGIPANAPCCDARPRDACRRPDISPVYAAPAPVVRPVVVAAPVYRPAYGYGCPVPYGPALPWPSVSAKRTLAGDHPLVTDDFS